jgi:hypothetical protein
LRRVPALAGPAGPSMADIPPNPAKIARRVSILFSFKLICFET